MPALGFLVKKGSRSITGSRKVAAQSSIYKTKFYSVHSNLRSDTFCWKTHLQNIPDKKNQAAWIPTVICVIEKCVHVSFARSITRPRQDALHDPLRDRDPLDRALMTSLIYHLFPLTSSDMSY